MQADTAELRIALGPARDQGPRPTCISFSFSDTHLVQLGMKGLLSPESLHQLATKRAAKPPGKGLALAEAMAGLRLDGQSTEAAWPYGSNLPLDAGCELNKASSQVLNFEPNVARRLLRTGEVLSLILDVDTAFYYYRAGTTLDLNLNSVVQARHAVAICGFREQGSGLEYFIRNSWGRGWGEEGHAWITSAYILARSPQIIRIYINAKPSCT
jgi:hypothetical protein